jgi:hypothetical protein
VTEPRPIIANRTLGWLIGLGAVAFIAMGYFLITVGDTPSQRGDTSTFSRSAIGHAAFLELLQELDIPVLVSRHASALRASDASLLVLAEPQEAPDLQEVLDAVRPTSTVLLVLPKWQSAGNVDSDGWIELAVPVGTGSSRRILDVVAPGGEIVGQENASWRGADFRARPTFVERTQLMRAPGLTPIVSADNGILVGEVNRRGRRIFVLSDPDVLANHGLWRRENATFLLSLIERFRVNDRAVVIDETIHGYVQPPSFWGLLVRPPYILATFQGLIVLGLLIWAASRRFGPPEPSGRPLDLGVSTLVETTARLLRRGSHGSFVISRYADMTVRSVANRLHAPRALKGDELVEWLDRVGSTRRIGVRYADIKRDVDRVAGPGDGGRVTVTAVGRELFHWKRTLLDGP